ncbi:methyltransferase domain-containing protein [Nonomuraea typhae]|uniref:methyltransferase domain-containing protein n=1 Tax=Nonomuraea typhae TaxID=2603600 RepID=UPI0012FC3DE6|nr:methyltransferase domain-containing protein [Nonomuraea typhae]
MTDLSDQIAGPFEPLGPRWLQALGSNPRGLFIPSQAWVSPGDGPGYVIDRDADASAWEKAVYSDISIVTQIDDGATPVVDGYEDGRLYSSSNSMPTIVAAELGLLGLHTDDHVLEIGTGTGWTAALISSFVGDGQVTTVEIDIDVYRQAGGNLARAGHDDVRLIHGDGTLGYPSGQPYDAVHVTVGAIEASPAWIEQTRPGGTIVFPWMPTWRYGAFVALRAVGDGTAVGRIESGCSFMMMRGQRSGELRGLGDDVRKRPARIDPQRIAGEWAASIFLNAMLPGVVCTTEQDGGFVLWAHSDTSAAYVTWDEEVGDWIVQASGDRDLYGEAEEVFLRWISWGCPASNRYGYSSTPEGDVIWVDHPGRVVNL